MDVEQALSLRSSSSSSLQHLLASGATMTKRHNAWLHMSRLEQRMEGLDQDLEHLGRDQRHEDYRAKVAAESRIKGAEEQAARDVRSAETRCAARIKAAEERLVAQQQAHEAKLSEAVTAYEAKLAETQRQSTTDLQAAEAGRIAEVAMAVAAARVSENMRKDAHDRLCQVHDATIATLREESASEVAALEQQHCGYVGELENRHSSEMENLHNRLSLQEMAFQNEMQQADDDFRAQMARSSASSMVHTAIIEEQAWIDSEQKSIALANKTREWEVKCAEATRLSDELAASMAARAALVKEGQVLSAKALSAETTLEQEVARLEALLADEQAKRRADVQRLEGLLTDEQASRRAEGERWSKKVQGLVSETERSVLVCVEVQKKCDLNQLENGALEAALEARAREAADMSDDLATLCADLAIVTGERDFVRHSYDTKLLENAALEITLSAKEQEVADLTHELSAERAKRAQLETSAAELKESLCQERARGDMLQTHVDGLQQAVEADQALMLSACAAATALNESLRASQSDAAELRQAVDADQAVIVSACVSAAKLNADVLASRRVAAKHSLILHRLAAAFGSPRGASVKQVMQEWRRVLSTRRRVGDAVRRWQFGLVDMVWRAWHRECIVAGSERIRNQFAEAETSVREEFGRREHDVYEGAQSLVAATQAHYESEIAVLQKRLQIATLSPRSPARQVLEPVAASSATRIPAVEMSADTNSDSDSDSIDSDEFHDVTPITREMGGLLSHEAGHAASPEDTSTYEFDHLRRLLARRTGEIARLVQELKEAKQVHKDSAVWAEELQAEVEARMAADARLDLEIDAAAVAQAASTEAAAQLKAVQDENAKLKSAEAVAFAELLDLQARYEDADEAKRAAEAALAERRSDEMHALAQIMELQAKYEEAEEAKTELEQQLAEADECRPEREQREAELAGMGHGRTKAAAAAMTHALEIAQFYEAEVVSLQKKLEREVLLRNEQSHELEREVVLRLATEAELARLEAAGPTAEAPVVVAASGGSARDSRDSDEELAALEADFAALVEEDMGALPAQLELDLTPRGTRAET